MSVIYGPVPSWRLGRSLGIDPVSSPHKTCSFDCLYCQLGGTNHPLCERRVFVSPQAPRSELAEIARSLQPDEVQLNTSLRPCPVPAVSPSDMEEAEAAFEGLNVVNVYRSERPQVTPLNEKETRKLRPEQLLTER